MIGNRFQNFLQVAQASFLMTIAVKEMQDYIAKENQGPMFSVENFLFCLQNFDRYKASRMVMDCLFVFDDHSITRMAVAICSILAAKISTVQTTWLGTKRNMVVSFVRFIEKFRHILVLGFSTKCHLGFMLCNFCHVGSHA